MGRGIEADGGGGSRAIGRLIRSDGLAPRVSWLLGVSLVLVLLLVPGCAGPQPALDGGLRLGASDEVEPGRYAVEEGTIYEVDLRCRVALPFNSESLELGDVETGPVELEPAPSPFYTLGVSTQLRSSSIRGEAHTTWLELATLEPVPGLGTYEETRDADREEAFEALRRVRGPQTTEMDLVQAKVREFHLEARVAFRIPEGIRTDALDLERKVGGALVAFFISPELPGEGVSLTLTAPLERNDYVMKATVGDSCPRLVMIREDLFSPAPSRDGDPAEAVP